MFRKDCNYSTEDAHELEHASVVLFFQRANSAVGII